MSSFRNHVQLIGNIGSDLNIPDLESGKKLVSFSLATNEYYRNDKNQKVEATEWHNVVAWGKGSEIGVQGKLRTRKYQDKEGNNRYATEIVANEVLLLGSRSEGSATNRPAQNATAKPQKATGKADKKAA